MKKKSNDKKWYEDEIAKRTKPPEPPKPPREGRMFMRPHYSGPRSKKFWKKVWDNDQLGGGALYSLGLILQNVEADILKKMKIHEEEGPL